MRVFSRKVGKKIIIDGCCNELTITQVDDDKVPTRVTAPLAVRIDREEVHRRRSELTNREMIDGHDRPSGM